MHVILRFIARVKVGTVVFAGSANDFIDFTICCNFVLCAVGIGENCENVFVGGTWNSRNACAVAENACEEEERQ